MVNAGSACFAVTAPQRSHSCQYWPSAAFQV